MELFCTHIILLKTCFTRSERLMEEKKEKEITGFTINDITSTSTCILVCGLI